MGNNYTHLYLLFYIKVIIYIQALIINLSNVILYRLLFKNIQNRVRLDDKWLMN